MNNNCSPNDDPDMRGCRDRNDVSGRMRGKRGDTLIGTIEAQYDVDLCVRSDMRLDTLREITGKHSIADIIRARSK